MLFAFVADIPNPWPPPKLVRARHQELSITLEVTFRTDGRVGAVVTEPGSPKRTVLTQPIQTNGHPRAAFVIEAKPGLVVVHMNGVQLDETDALVELPPYRPVELSTVLSVVHPDVAAACATAVAYRRTEYGSYSPKPGFRATSLAESKGQLHDASCLLSDAIAQVRAGREHFMRAVRSELRALLVESFTPQGKRKELYDPLLFRVAGRLGAALPVWAHKSGGMRPPNDRYMRLTAPSLIQRTPEETIVDLRDWLEDVAGAWTDGNGVNRVVTNRELIAKSANVYGGSHTDPAVPAWLDAYDMVEFADRGSLAMFLLATGDAVAQLGLLTGMDERAGVIKK